MPHLYFAIENTGMTNGQRGQLVAALQRLGRNDDPQPCNRNHWRVRLDQQAIIFEALFSDADLTVAAFTQYVADALGMPLQSITATTDSTTFATLPSPVVTFSRPAGTPRLRVILFGGTSATW